MLQKQKPVRWFEHQFQSELLIINRSLLMSDLPQFLRLDLTIKLYRLIPEFPVNRPFQRFRVFRLGLLGRLRLVRLCFPLVQPDPYLLYRPWVLIHQNCCQLDLFVRSDQFHLDDHHHLLNRFRVVRLNPYNQLLLQALMHWLLYLHNVLLRHLDYCWGRVHF